MRTLRLGWGKSFVQGHFLRKRQRQIQTLVCLTPEPLIDQTVTFPTVSPRNHMEWEWEGMVSPEEIRSAGPRIGRQKLQMASSPSKGWFDCLSMKPLTMGLLWTVRVIRPFENALSPERHVSEDSLAQPLWHCTVSPASACPLPPSLLAVPCTHRAASLKGPWTCWLFLLT